MELYPGGKKKLVRQAQSLMISYWSSVEKLSSLEQELLEAENSEESVKRSLPQAWLSSLRY